MTKQALNLTDKVAIVTGGSRGIGRAIAERLADSGAKVVVHYGSNDEAAQEAVAAIEQAGGIATAVKGDAGFVRDIQNLFDVTEKQYGGVDVVVTAAGIQIHKPFVETTEEDFDRVFNVNAKGTFFALQQAASRLREGGNIVAVSTSLTAMMVPGYGAYTGTKGAVEQFVRSLAKELGGRNISINAIAPGPVATDLLKSTETEQSLQFLAGLSGFGRLGEPEDIANAVAFLASTDSRWISGQVIRANGALL